MEGFKEICDVTKVNNGNGNSTKRVKAKNLPVVEPNPLKVLTFFYLELLIARIYLGLYKLS